MLRNLMTKITAGVDQYYLPGGRQGVYYKSENRKFMLKEVYLHTLLQAVYECGELNIYDHAASVFAYDSPEFGGIKEWAEQLVNEKLATYADDQHTTIKLTNYGRYWIIKGGYEAYLLGGHHEKKKNHSHTHSKDELLEARLRLTHFRLIGFWLTIILSLLGFGLSIYNLVFILMRK